MSSHTQDPPKVARNFGYCLLWLMFYGFIGYVVLMVVLHVVRNLSEKGELVYRRALMDEQIKELKAGDIDCLVHPDPLFINDILADADCIKNIRDLYLGGDLSDERLSRLRELPNLRCIIFLRAENSDMFLERIRGTTSIEALNFAMTFISIRGIDSISSLPNLKSLCLPVDNLKAADLESLKKHLVLEKLFFTRAKISENLTPILQSLPRLRSVTIEGIFDSKNASSFEQSLRGALPNCECIVREVDHY